MWGMVLKLMPNTGRAMRNTCISDAFKTLLLNLGGFFEHLTDGLLLHDDHPRVTGPHAGDTDVKAAVQRDFPRPSNGSRCSRRGETHFARTKARRRGVCSRPCKAS
jgi:hypothetical protein